MNLKHCIFLHWLSTKKLYINSMNKKYFASIAFLLSLGLVGFWGFQFIKNNTKEVENLNSSVSPTVALDASQNGGTTKEAIAEAFSQKYNRPASTFTVEAAKDTGLFAQGSVRFEGEMGGGVWFGAKTDKGWELAFDGNGIMSCEIADKYSFPKDIVPGCLDTENGNKFVER